MKVGIIGLGTMGKHAALNIQRAGFEEVDVRPEAITALRRLPTQLMF